MSYPLCRHILTNGHRCKSPALRESAWCFYHRNLHDRHSPYRHTETTKGYLCPGLHIQLTALEDRESVQVALSVVINALATGRLETKRATALLYGLQLASANAANLHNSFIPSETVQSAETTEDGLALAEPAVFEPFVFDEDDEDEDEDD